MAQPWPERPGGAAAKSGRNRAYRPEADAGGRPAGLTAQGDSRGCADGAAVARAARRRSRQERGNRAYRPEADAGGRPAGLTAQGD